MRSDFRGGWGSEMTTKNRISECKIPRLYENLMTYITLRFFKVHAF